MFGNEFTKSESTFHYTHLRKDSFSRTKRNESNFPPYNRYVRKSYSKKEKEGNYVPSNRRKSGRLSFR